MCSNIVITDDRNGCYREPPFVRPYRIGGPGFPCPRQAPRAGAFLFVLIGNAPMMLSISSSDSRRGSTAMRVGLFAVAALIAMLSTDASAQVLNLSGPYRCIQGCGEGLIGQPAFITQDGWNLRLVNEASMPSRAWIDRPGHIWVDSWHEGAVYSADGTTIQFDRGTVWQRDLAALAPVVPVPSAAPAPSVVLSPPRSARPAQNARVAPAPIERAPAAINAFDGQWSVVIHTQAGDCGPEYRYGVQISNGNITTDAGQSAGLSGRVLPNGAVSVSVSAGGAYAVGQGRMSPSNGGGTWRGQSSGESCAGVWQAARRG